MPRQQLPSQRKQFTLGIDIQKQIDLEVEKNLKRC